MRSRWRGLWLLCLVPVIVGAPGLAPAQAPAVKVYLVRHAEPGPGDDPSLSAFGLKRALDLVAVLQNSGITAIFTSTYARTRQTAAPIAAALAIAVTPIGLQRGVDAHIADTANAVRSHPGGAVLVVGHSNTVPAVIGLLGGGKLPDICETTHDLLFILELTPRGTSVAQRRYGAPSPAAAADCL
jgi:broad specificity phosphatase PhoE